VTTPFEISARLCAGFADQLRRHGVETSPEQTTALYAALHQLDRVRLRDLYLAGRVTMVGAREQFTAYDAAFRAYFLGADGTGATAVAVSRPVAVAESRSPEPTAGTPSARPAEDADDEVDHARLTPSDIQVLKEKSFAAMDADERRRAAALVRTLDADLPRRRSRRRVRAHRGRHLDTRRSLRAALRTDGEPIRLARRRNPTRERPITFVVDVSGSMAPYALAVLRFAHALAHAGHRVEVFTVGVRATRITEQLRRTCVDAALSRIAAAVRDWDGGTRLGTSLATVLDRYGGHRAVRGAVVVVCSDGLDRDDPAILATAMQHLHRIAHRVMWLNPLKGDPRYRPLQRGMAAALPHVDVFLPGHNLTSLEQLCAALAAVRRRSA
jgi:Protein containing von Willebrand factor type A (vWA) domain